MNICLQFKNFPEVFLRFVAHSRLQFLTPLKVAVIRSMLFSSVV